MGLRRCLVASDIEMGAGGPTDDCPRADRIPDLLHDFAVRHRGDPVDYVFNGDTFDFLKVPLQGRYPLHVGEATALEKLSRIAAAHPGFFRGLGELLGAGEHRVHFITGNHDFELGFPAVQREIQRLIGRPERVRFPGLSLELGDVHIEHGSQGDPMFHVDPSAPFVQHRGEPILNLPWGATAVMEIALPYHAELFDLDRIKPKDVLFSALPIAKTLLMERARVYWTREFWRGAWVERDPLKQPSFAMLKEVFHRLIAQDAEVSFGDHYLRAIADDAKHRVYVLSHEHRGREIEARGKKIVSTGCLRDEFAYDSTSKALKLSDKSVAELAFEDGRAVLARLIPFALPGGPVTPRSLEELEPIIARRLAELRDQSSRREAIEAAGV